jgi:hypothetical protein
MDAEGKLDEDSATLLDWDRDRQLAFTDAVDVLLCLFQSGKSLALGTACMHLSFFFVAGANLDLVREADARSRGPWQAPGAVRPLCQPR